MQGQLLFSLHVMFELLKVVMTILHQLNGLLDTEDFLAFVELRVLALISLVLSEPLAALFNCTRVDPLVVIQGVNVVLLGFADVNRQNFGTHELIKVKLMIRVQHDAKHEVVIH